MNRSLARGIFGSAFALMVYRGNLDFSAPKTVFIVACAAIALVMWWHWKSAAAASPKADPLVREPRYGLDYPVVIMPYDHQAGASVGKIQRLREGGFELLAEGEMRVGEVAMLVLDDRITVGIVSRCNADTEGYAIGLELFYSVNERRAAPQNLEVNVAVA
jgi:hypothetical protein